MSARNEQMNPDRQRTLGREVRLQGVGVHTGEASSLTIRPAAAGTGLRFRRTDVEGSPEIPATLDHVVSTERGTSLGQGEARVQTVEHVLAALFGAGVDNALMDLDGPEPPIRDGSFRDYAEAVAGAGTTEQDQPAGTLRVRDTISVRGGGGQSYVVTPSDELHLSVTIDFAHPAIGRQFGSFRIDPDRFGVDIAPARTFGYESDVENLRSRGLARGATLENTVVLSEGAVLGGELRFPDEFLRHKVGDLVGDLALLGARLRGHVVAEKPSHGGNVAMGLGSH
jgi:UDP-3-O-[3-hydroxymyristoyl] N-acetylglucosamine deacetylase / 3-hydroxyacyl-[acyl-carrier-protein] dehydratase